MPSTATYLYGLVASAAVPSLARVPAGVPGATRPVIVPVARSLRLVVAEVPLETYGPGALEQGLRDLQWVGAVAVAHESVVEYFARRRAATVVPMKLFTMFSTVERALADVARRRREIDAVLAGIRGCAEWGVRVTLPPPKSAAARSGPRATSGAAFLAAKKQARDESREAVMAAAEAAEDAFEILAAIARGARRRGGGEPEGAVRPPLLDAAFLVPAGAALGRFKRAATRAAQRCARTGARMTLTGPWPAYNFVQAEDRP